MNAADIRPYVDLITWQVVALAGGIVFLPAIYVFVFRINSLAIGLMKADLTQRQAKQIDKEVEQQTVEAAEENSAKPEQVAEEIHELEDEGAGDKKEMYKNIVQAWTNLSIIVQALALPHGGTKSLKSFSRNVETLRSRNVIPRDEATRLQYMHEQRFHLRDHPGELTPEAYRSYIRRAGRLAGRLTKLTDGFKAFGPTASSRADEVRPN